MKDGGVQYLKDDDNEQMKKYNDILSSGGVLELDEDQFLQN